MGAILCCCCRSNKKKGNVELSDPWLKTKVKGDNSNQMTDNKGIGSTFNMMHQNIQAKKSSNNSHHPQHSVMVTITKENGYSVITALLNVDAELVRNTLSSNSGTLTTSALVSPALWVRKRGHVIKNWKERLCILDNEDLKYFASAVTNSNPIQGKALKGRFNLIGSTMKVYQIDANGISVTLEGCYETDKELSFEVDASDQAYRWIQLLFWTMRNTTMPLYVQHYKLLSSSAATSAEIKNKKYDLWINYEEKKYVQALRNLNYQRIIRIFKYKKNGQVIKRYCMLKLWLAVDGGPKQKISKDVINSRGVLGLMWEYLPQNRRMKKSLTQSEDNRKKLSDDETSNAYSIQGSQLNGPYDKYEINVEHAHKIRFADISDLVVYETGKINPIVPIPMHIRRSHGGGSKSQDDDNSKNHYSHEMCQGRKAKLLMIQMKNGMTFDMDACCIHDYEDILFSLRDIILFQELKNNLDQAVQPVDATSFSKPSMTGKSTYSMELTQTLPTAPLKALSVLRQRDF